MIHEGKKTLGDQIKAKTITFQQFIFSDKYFITNLDIWILSQKYDIPIILFSRLPNLAMNGNAEENFVFIISPVLKYESIPKYKLIKSQDNNVSFSLSIISETCKVSLRQSIENKMSLEKYLQDYKIIEKVRKERTVKKPDNLVLIDDNEDETSGTTRQPNVEETSVAMKLPKGVIAEQPLKLNEEFEINVNPVIEKIEEPIPEITQEPPPIPTEQGQTRRNKNAVTIKRTKTRKIKNNLVEEI